MRDRRERARALVKRPYRKGAAGMDECIKRGDAINAAYEAFADGRSAYTALEAVPAADVRHVVTCGKCEFWTKQEASLQGRCALWGIYPTAAWFCANGCARAPLQEGGGGNGRA